jgi:acetolactate synthase-1/2/3 large subunit
MHQEREYPERISATKLENPDFAALARAYGGWAASVDSTAAQYGADLLVIIVDTGAYGTIRMHQERDYPARISGTGLANPDFVTLAEAYGGWAERVETTDQFAPALARSKERGGIRVIHCVTDVEIISNQTTIEKLRAG